MLNVICFNVKKPHRSQESFIHKYFLGTWDVAQRPQQRGSREGVGAPVFYQGETGHAFQNEK